MTLLAFPTPMLVGGGALAPIVQTINTAGAGSYTFTRSGLLMLQAIGAGASGNKTGNTATICGGGGGAEADNVGGLIAVNAGDILYWNIGAGGPALTGLSNVSRSGGDTWAQVNTNAAPTSSAKGVLAKGATQSSSGANSSAGGSATNSVGVRKFSGGSGIYGGSGGGGSSAAPGSAGVSGGNSSASGAGAVAPAGGGNGGAVSVSDTVAATDGSQPGGGGGAQTNSSNSVPSGKGGDGQLIFTLT